MNFSESLNHYSVSISNIMGRSLGGSSVLILGIFWLVGALSAAAPDFDAAADAYRANDFVTARAAFLQRANAGDQRSMAILGMMSRFGEGIPVDLTDAFNWYLAAAQAGHPPAQFQVARMLNHGEGVAADAQRAQYWFNQSAEQGYAKAIDLLTQQSPEAVIAAPVDDAVDDALTDRVKTISRVWNFQLPTTFKTTEVPLRKNHQLPVVRVQLGAMKTKDAAIDLWALIQDELPNLTLNVPFTVSHYAEPGQQSIFRLRVGEFQSTDDGQFFCRQVKKVSRRPCWVINDPSQ